MNETPEQREPKPAVPLPAEFIRLTQLYRELYTPVNENDETQSVRCDK